jgi:hypothetical protein
MKTHSLLLTLSMALLTTQGSLANNGPRRLNEVSVNSLCKTRGMNNTNLNHVLTLEGERLGLSKTVGFRRNTLFVGTHFFVERTPESFSNESLLNPIGIGKISESKVSNFKLVDADSSEAFFTSSKELPFFNSLDCSNKVSVKSWEDYQAETQNPELIQELKAQSCFTNKLPFKVTDQEVFACNDHFKRSRIITFYFNEGAQKSRVLTLSFSELTSRPNFIKKNVMKSEVRKSLKGVASIIEDLQSN